MLKIYSTKNCVTVHLTGTEYDAIRFYTPKLLRKLNNQVPGCKNFGIHAPGHDPYDIKGTIFEKMMMPYNYTFTEKYDGITVTYQQALNAAKKVVLDEYHADLRYCKRILISEIFKWIGDLEDAMVDINNDLLMEEDPFELYDAPVENRNGRVYEKHVVDEAMADIKVEPVDIEKLINDAPKDMRDAIANAATIVSSEDEEDDDDDVIEGDLVTPGANFTTREPLTDKDEDDYTTPDVPLPRPTSMMLDPTGKYHSSDMAGVNTILDEDSKESDDPVDESNPEDIL